MILRLETELERRKGTLEAEQPLARVCVSCTCGSAQLAGEPFLVSLDILVRAERGST